MADPAETAEIPRYFPLHSNLQEKFQRLKPNCIEEQELNDLKTRLLGSVEGLVEMYTSEGFEEFELRDDQIQAMEDAAKSFKETQELIAENSQFKHLFMDNHKRIRLMCNNEDELDFSNIEHYKEITGIERKSLAISLEQELEAADEIDLGSVNDKNLDYLRNTVLVLQHPLDPLPNDDDDDDFHVEGGKVDLKCPITQQTFQDPYTSKRCGHTFDKLGIESTFRGGVTQKCPIPGCIATLKASDFQKDYLMSLRVKAFEKSEKKKRNHNEDIEMLV